MGPGIVQPPPRKEGEYCAHWCLTGAGVTQPGVPGAGARGPGGPSAVDVSQRRVAGPPSVAASVPELRGDARAVCSCPC